MLKFIKENKKLAIGTGIITVAAGIYIYYTRKQKEENEI